MIFKMELIKNNNNNNNNNNKAEYLTDVPGVRKLVTPTEDI
jgi:hypothetical protein